MCSVLCKMVYTDHTACAACERKKSRVGTTYAPVTTNSMKRSNPYSSDEDSDSDPEYNPSSDGENSSSESEPEYISSLDHGQSDEEDMRDGSGAKGSIVVAPTK